LRTRPEVPRMKNAFAWLSRRRASPWTLKALLALCPLLVGLSGPDIRPAAAGRVAPARGTPLYRTVEALAVPCERSGNDGNNGTGARAPRQGQDSSDSKLLVCGGFCKGDIYADVLMAALTAEGPVAGLSWEARPPLPVPLQGHAVLAAAGRIYVFGGLTGFSGRKALYSGEIYSAAIAGGRPGAWKKTAALPGPLGYHAAVRAGKWIFVTGGFSPTGFGSDSDGVWNYEIRKDGTLGQPFRAGALLKATRGHASVVHGNRLFIMGGHSDDRYFDDVYSAPIDDSGRLGSWAKTAPLPAGLVHFGAALRVFGGQDEKGLLHDAVYAARLSEAGISGWEKAGVLPAPSSRMSVSLRGGAVIIAGGGFGWEEPVFTGIFAADFRGGGRLGPWRKAGDLPRPTAFHGAVLVPDDLEMR
jgi:hypothetical protein